MAYDEALESISRPAGADLSTKQYYGVKLNSSGQIVLVAADGEAAIGILQNAPDAAGKVAVVGIKGVSKVVGGGAVTAGNRFSFNSSGQAVAVGSGDDFSMGVAIETIASGKIYPVLLQPIGAIL